MQRFLPTSTDRDALSRILATLRTCNDPGTPLLTAQIGVFSLMGRVSIFRSVATRFESNEPTETEAARVDAALVAAGFEVTK